MGFMFMFMFMFMFRIRLRSRFRIRFRFRLRSRLRIGVNIRLKVNVKTMFGEQFQRLAKAGGEREPTQLPANFVLAINSNHVGFA